MDARSTFADRLCSASAGTSGSGSTLRVLKNGCTGLEIVRFESSQLCNIRNLMTLKLGPSASAPQACTATASTTGTEMLRAHAGHEGPRAGDGWSSTGRRGRDRPYRSGEAVKDDQKPACFARSPFSVFFGRNKRACLFKGLPFCAPIFQRKIRFRPLSRVSPGPTHKARPSLAPRPPQPPWGP